jgi:HD-like signal output (HDOD) protein
MTSPTTAFQTSSIDELLARIDQLPHLPSVACTLLRHGDGVHIDPQELCDRLRGEQDVARRILRVANSSFYGLEGSVNSLDDALVVLGSATLRSIAVTAALIGPFRISGSKYFDQLKYWRHALGSAVIARLLASTLSAPATLAFHATLIHQIGMLAFCAVDPAGFDLLHAKARVRGVSMARTTRDELGWDHFQLGAGIARRWALPEPLCTLLERCEMPPEGRALLADRGLVDMIHLADRLAHILLPGLTELPRERLGPLLAQVLRDHPVSPVSLARLDLPEGLLLDVVQRAARELQRLETMLG